VGQFEIHIPPAAKAAVDFMAVAARLEAVPFQNNFKLTHCPLKPKRKPEFFHEHPKA
jgi:hypothetical protein